MSAGSGLRSPLAAEFHAAFEIREPDLDKELVNRMRELIKENPGLG